MSNIGQYGILSNTSKHGGHTPVNVLPVVDAGLNQLITLPTNTVTLTAVASDVDGNVVSYRWAKISGPNCTLSTITLATLTVTNMLAGSYVFRVTVTDNKGAKASDTVLITVNAIPNIPPIANTGQNRIITLPISTSTLSGSGTDSDGVISSYLWTQTSGPSTSTIVSPTLPNTSVINLIEGTYIFQLQVTDNNGATAKSAMSVTVNPIPNQAPIINAGSDQIITLPTNSVALMGTANDVDGTISSYLWTQISGPSAAIISIPGSVTTIASGLNAGTYIFQLAVTDNSGATATDTISVLVNPLPNVPPIASAGIDQNVGLPTSTTTLIGSGIDSDGTISSYTWIQLSGPNTSTIVSPTSATTSVTGLILGTYSFQLTVTDNQGATGTDIVQVTMLPEAQPTVQAAIALTTNVLPANPISSATLISPATLNIMSASTGGVNIGSYNWTKISGPAGGIIGTPTASSTIISSLLVGTYVFRLTVWLIAPWSAVSSTADITVVVTAPTVPTFYVDTINGLDTNNGTSTLTPWKTITKVNTALLANTIAPGNQVLFRRGQTFTGSLTMGRSGSSTLPITFGSYDVGAKPIITSLSSISAWVNLGGNIWESAIAASTLPTCMMVVINGVNTPMGRFPNISSTAIITNNGNHPIPGNNGWLCYNSGLDINATTKRITDATLTATPNWTGADAVVKSYKWVIHVGKITTHSGSSITYTDDSTDTPSSIGQSYFIQNDIRCLTEEGEWYYNPTTKKLSVYHVGATAPTGVQIATSQSLITRNSKNYIILDSLDLRGSNQDLIDLGMGDTPTGWTIQNCDISFAGRDAVWSLSSTTNCTITNCTITDSNNNGINFGLSNNGVIVKDNTVINTGINAGMTQMNTTNYTSGVGIKAEGDNVSITGNKVIHVGYNGINYGGNNTLVNKNFVQDFCSVKTDGSGIYTHGGDGAAIYVNMVVEDNIVVDSSPLGDIGTASETSEFSTNGIYLDGMVHNAVVRRNSVAHVNASGIYMNYPVDVQVDSNNIYDCRFACIHNNKPQWFSTFPVQNLSITNNIAVAKDLSNYAFPSTTFPFHLNSKCFYAWSEIPGETLAWVNTHMTLNGNVWARPLDFDLISPPAGISPNYTQANYGKWGTICIVRPTTIGSAYIGYGEYGDMYTYTLAQFKAAYPLQDVTSTKGPIQVSSTSKIRFEYNETSVAKTIALGITVYRDMKGNFLTGNIILQPYTSITLLAP